MSSWTSRPGDTDAIAELDNNRDRLGPHVACFSDEDFPRHFRGYDIRKRQNLEKWVFRCLSENGITFNSFSNEPNIFLGCQKKRWCSFDRESKIIHPQPTLSETEFSRFGESVSFLESYLLKWRGDQPSAKQAMWEPSPSTRLDVSSLFVLMLSRFTLFPNLFPLTLSVTEVDVDWLASLADPVWHWT
jgi:hypothetical protein